MISAFRFLESNREKISPIQIFRYQDQRFSSSFSLFSFLRAFIKVYVCTRKSSFYSKNPSRRNFFDGLHWVAHRRMRICIFSTFSLSYRTAVSNFPSLHWNGGDWGTSRDFHTSIEPSLTFLILFCFSPDDRNGEEEEEHNSASQ